LEFVHPGDGLPASHRGNVVRLRAVRPSSRSRRRTFDFKSYSVLASPPAHFDVVRLQATGWTRTERAEGEPVPDSLRELLDLAPYLCGLPVVADRRVKVEQSDQRSSGLADVTQTHVVIVNSFQRPNQKIVITAHFGGFHCP